MWCVRIPLATNEEGEASVSSDTDRAARTAQNEALFREVNERVKELNTTFDALARRAEWICECGNTDCVEPVQMTQEEYESVRARGNTCFLVKPGDAHVVPEVERIVERHERYWVVEKVGVAAEIAEDEAAFG
jgi:hypothetical protein